MSRSPARRIRERGEDIQAGFWQNVRVWDVNDDGSVDLFFGLEKPTDDNETNFVLTKLGEGWFAYFRFYSPMDAYFDKTWVPNDFENISSWTDI